MISMELDGDRTSASLHSFAAVAGVSLTAAVTQVARNWVRSLIQLTPPYKSRKKGQPVMDTKAQKIFGENKAKNDISSLFFSVETVAEKMRSESHRRQIKAALASADAEKVKAALNAANIYPDDVIAGPSRDIHKRFADRTFHIPPENKHHFAVMHRSAMASYSTLITSRVGNAKSGWNTAGLRLGLRIPAWIKKHSGGGGFKGVTDQANPSIEFWNSVPYLDDRHYANMMDSAGRFALEMLEKQTAYYMREIGNGNMAAMQARARQQTREALEV